VGMECTGKAQITAHRPDKNPLDGGASAHACTARRTLLLE